MNRGKIILLNGVSSSGKTTLSNELVKLMPSYFHMSIDDFDVFIEKMEDRNNNHLIPVETEYFFHRTIAMFSDKGINLVVDHVLHDKYTREDCLEVLANYPVLFVGVHCDLDELERREMARGDRSIGQARKQLEYVHKNDLYDVEINTFSDGMEACSNKVVESVHNVMSFDGWQRTRQTLICRGEVDGQK